MAGNLNIDNILGGETNCSSDLILLNDKTTINSTTGELISNEESLPLGNYTLKLYVYCDFCIKNKTPIVDIDICIWDRNYSSTNCEWTKKRIW